MEFMIQHDKDGNEFYATIQGKKARLQYNILSDGKILDFYSTFVPPELRGHDIGEKIVLFALDYAKDNQFKIIPSCPFVKRIIERHSEYLDIVAKNLK